MTNIAAVAVAAVLAVLPSEVSRQEFTAAGGTVFTFTFKTLSASHVKTYVNTVLQTTGVAVALNANQDSSPGGTVTFTAAPTVGAAVRVERTLPLTQDSTWTSFSHTKAKTLEADLDKRAMQAQQVNRKADDYIAQAMATAAVPSSATPIVPEGGTAAQTLGHWLAEAVNVKGNGAMCNGIDDDAPALIAAQIAAGGGKTLLVTCKLRIMSAVGTISVPIRFQGFGSLDLQAGGSVTLSGPLDAPLSRIFWMNGGTLTFNAKVSAVHPQWWGAAGDGVTDDTGAIQAARVAAQGSPGARLVFPPGTFLVDDSALAPTAGTLHVQGAGKHRTFLKSAAGGHVIDLGASVNYNVTIEDLSISGNGGTGHGIYQHGATPSFIRVKNVRIDSVGGKGVYLTNVWQSVLEDVEVSGAADNAFDIYSIITTRMDGCYARIVAAGMTGFRIRKGAVQMRACNGVDTGSGAGASWGVFGSNVADDGEVQYVRASLDGCNVEDFPSTGIRLKGGTTIHMRGGGITAPSTGTVTALAFDFADKPDSVIWGDVVLATKGAAWTNGQPIHNNYSRAPYVLLGSNGSSLFATYRDDLDGANGTIPHMEAEYITFLMNALSVAPALKVAGPLIQTRVTPTYGATVSIDARLGNAFVVTATNATPFTINSPSAATVGQRFTVTVRNASGGALGAVTWGGVYKMATWTAPANGFSRSVEFVYDGTNAVEVTSTPADVPN